MARAADEAGFDFIAVMDHFFQIPVIGPPEREMLEAYTHAGLPGRRDRAGQAADAGDRRRSTGIPGILAKTVTTLDVLSGGRAWLGIGAAWNEEESPRAGRPVPAGGRAVRAAGGDAADLPADVARRRDRPIHGKHYQLERPLNSPQALSKPHPPIMIGGGGERKTLRLVARYAQACNLFPGPDLARKLDVLRAHCDAEGRDYDEITKTCYFIFDVGEKGEKTAEMVDQLGGLAEMGFQAAIGAVANVWEVTPLEIIGSQVIPQVASL